jgi:hypothetical protein
MAPIKGPKMRNSLHIDSSTGTSVYRSFDVCSAEKTDTTKSWSDLSSRPCCSISFVNGLKFTLGMIHSQSNLKSVVGLMKVECVTRELPPLVSLLTRQR